jgi:deoxycytidylate deaminase
MLKTNSQKTVTAVYKNFAGKQDAKATAIKMIEDGRATCVVVKDNKIISAESPKGISHIIKLYEAGMLKGAYVADTVIGKAAAMIFSLGGVKSCYGYTTSKPAVKWLNEHNIAISYNTCSDYIINRTRDGMCPMEETVANITNENEALILLKAKVEELRKINEPHLQS